MCNFIPCDKENKSLSKNVSTLSWFETVWGILELLFGMGSNLNYTSHYPVQALRKV